MDKHRILQPVLRLQRGSPLPLHAQVQQLLRELCEVHYRSDRFTLTLDLRRGDE